MFCPVGSTGVTASLATHPGPPACTQGFSKFQPRCTYITCHKKRIRSNERFDRPGTTSKQLRGRCQHGWRRGIRNKFSACVQSGPTRVARLIHAGNFDTQAEQQACHSEQNEASTPPSLHRESASRACRKFPSLFNSPNSRKHSCSFCQAPRLAAWTLPLPAECSNPWSCPSPHGN